jgi:electron transport complex protein RnfC
LPPKDTHIDALLINGAECEPFLTTDHRTMVEFPDRVWFGVRIMMKALGVPKVVIGIEKNKPDAIEILERTKPDDLNAEVQGLYVKYPQGAEKMLIKAVMGREVPSGKLPMHVGAVVQNVGTIACIAEIFETGLPLIERVVTVTGPGVNKPGNLIVPVGAKFKDILAFCGGIKENVTEILSGGPMMGAAQPDLEAPATKGVTGIVVLTEKESRPRTVYPCISCGHCLDACPMFLNPSKMGKLAQTARYPDMAEEANLWDCMLCGACSYVCPSNIPLSQMFGMAKYQLGRIRRKEGAA